MSMADSCAVVQMYVWVAIVTAVWPQRCQNRVLSGVLEFNLITSNSELFFVKKDNIFYKKPGKVIFLHSFIWLQILLASVLL